MRIGPIAAVAANIASVANLRQSSASLTGETEDRRRWEWAGAPHLRC